MAQNRPGKALPGLFHCKLLAKRRPGNIVEPAGFRQQINEKGSGIAVRNSPILADLAPSPMVDGTTKPGAGCSI
jgi:hypothetical protein